MLATVPRKPHIGTSTIKAFIPPRRKIRPEASLYKVTKSQRFIDRSADVKVGRLPLALFGTLHLRTAACLTYGNRGTDDLPYNSIFRLVLPHIVWRPP
jgi:hypothetical protein